MAPNTTPASYPGALFSVSVPMIVVCLYCFLRLFIVLLSVALTPERNSFKSCHSSASHRSKPHSHVHSQRPAIILLACFKNKHSQMYWI